MGITSTNRPRRYRGLHRGPQWTVAMWYSSVVMAVLALVKSRGTVS